MRVDFLLDIAPILLLSSGDIFTIISRPLVLYVLSLSEWFSLCLLIKSSPANA